jgi:hypothetical protein
VLSNFEQTGSLCANNNPSHSEICFFSSQKLKCQQRQSEGFLRHTGRVLEPIFTDRTFKLASLTSGTCTVDSHPLCAAPSNLILSSDLIGR